MGTKAFMEGNLTKDVAFRTSGENEFANFSIAVSHRTRNADGQWEDGTPMYVDVSTKNKGIIQALKNSPDAFVKGTSVLVYGDMWVEQWEDKDGNARLSHKMWLDTLGLNPMFATVTYERARKNDAGSEEKPKKAAPKQKAKAKPKPAEVEVEESDDDYDEFFE